MKAYSYVVDICKEKFPFSIGDEIGYGAQGQVFNIEGTNKVIKFSYSFFYQDIDHDYVDANEVINFIIRERPSYCVGIFETGKLRSGVRVVQNGTQNYTIYYTIQEKLVNLSDDEKKVFKTICQLLNDELELKRDIGDVLTELSAWFSFDKEKVLNFYNDIVKMPIHHNDLHRRNFMKDALGNYKLIDFDLARLVK